MRRDERNDIYNCTLMSIAACSIPVACLATLYLYPLGPILGEWERGSCTRNRVLINCDNSGGIQFR